MQVDMFTSLLIFMPMCAVFAYETHSPNIAFITASDAMCTTACAGNAVVTVASTELCIRSIFLLLLLLLLLVMMIVMMIVVIILLLLLRRQLLMLLVLVLVLVLVAGGSRRRYGRDSVGVSVQNDLVDGSGGAQVFVQHQQSVVCLGFPLFGGTACGGV